MGVGAQAAAEVGTPAGPAAGDEEGHGALLRLGMAAAGTRDNGQQDRQGQACVAIIGVLRGR
jgi:hypothetical protein